eukprot:CAMPEP_0119497520 /NCGR_PEP_ID=MMETSP1344-20130328/20535_1 /TAXON_ID=236787 /ORGANISM="Florenciella parvula, Strain CCMP2471" /LENGTH=489 /DNA_ID=CAMNT_0007533315 /DNA_START=14 /DNA_END=1480 /DNA_ORIENTATION=-
MGDVAELEDELESTRAELETLQADYDKLVDERDTTMSRLEAEFDTKRAEIEDKSKRALDELQAESDSQLEHLTVQLDQMRRAVTGDACGWEEKTDENGAPYFENSETGEKAFEKPEILAFAQTIGAVEDGANDKASLQKAQKKQREADTKKREAEVKLNEARSETQNLRGLVKGWKESAEVIFDSANVFNTAMDEINAKLKARSELVSDKTEIVVRAVPNLNKTTEKVVELKANLRAREQEVKRQNKQINKLTKELEKAREELAALRDAMNEQLEKICAPLREEVSTSYALLMQEKAAREADRQELADLWPDGWLMPTILKRYRSLTEEEKLAKRDQAEAIDAERTLRADIRAKVMEAYKWETKQDDYGRTFYEHMDTGASEWEQPEAMLYTPPAGRDELGNPVPVLPEEKSEEEAAEEVVDDKSEEPPPDPGKWEKQTDEWGEVYYVNDVTGETAWEKPEVVDPAKEAMEASGSLLAGGSAEEGGVGL